MVGNNDILRLLVCGDVDDGKSTLIGQLMRLAGNLPDDQMRVPEEGNSPGGAACATTVCPPPGGGSSAEADPGIAYGHFATRLHKFMVAESSWGDRSACHLPGAPQCHAALILVDARHGVQLQSRRDAFICAMMGIPHLLFVVNKMDLARWSEKDYRDIEARCQQLVGDLERFGLPLRKYGVVPVSALTGDNVAALSPHMAWYQNATLLNWLQGFQPPRCNEHAAVLLPTHAVIKVAKVQLVWMAEEPLFAGRHYVYRCEYGEVTAEIISIRNRVDLGSYLRLACEKLSLHDIGEAELSLSWPVPFDPYREDSAADSFLLVDPVSNATVACGTIQHGMRRADNVHWQRQEVGREGWHQGAATSRYLAHRPVRFR